MPYFNQDVPFFLAYHEEDGAEDVSNRVHLR